MVVLSPVAHLESVSRDYPGAWKQYAKFVADRRTLGDWPGWCYCPMAAAYAIVSGGGANHVPLERMTEVARLAALAAWRPTQGIYRFDEALFANLVETPLVGDIPTEHLHRLPEWCVYVETPSLGDTAGFFAHLEYDANDARAELRLLLDSRSGGLAPIPLHLGATTVEEAAELMIAKANENAAERAWMMPASYAASVAELVPPFISLLLYLCSGEAELRPTRGAKRPEARPGLRRGRDGEPYQPAADRPEVWETGFALGAALRAAKTDEVAATGATVRGHIRRAHWHSYWVGSGEARRLELRWLPPIAVNLPTAAEPTVRNVKEPT